MTTAHPLQIVWILPVLLIVLTLLVLYVGSFIWIYRDAMRRGTPGHWLAAALLIALFLWPLGLVFWLAIRDKPAKKTVAPPPVVGKSPPPAPAQCPQCGATLATGAPQGLCPACLLMQGVASETVPRAEGATFVPPVPAELAKHFPQLEILELLGQGGMGAVYKARQKELDRLVALKILPPLSAKDPGFAERFTREARALARLNHPNIVAVYDFGQSRIVGQASSLSSSPSTGSSPPVGQASSLSSPPSPVPPAPLYYVMMEFVDGVNLRQLLHSEKLDPKQALAIVPQICEGLQFAHDEGIVHRDIKPENILLDKKGRVKIADFGLAKILGKQPSDFTITGKGDKMGTPHYMAPEQIEHPQQVDHRADIYSLGVVFYEMLTGELPLGRFAPPSKKVVIDVRLDEVVLRALEKEPELRYQHASEVRTIVNTIVTTPGEGRALARPKAAGKGAAEAAPSIPSTPPQSGAGALPPVAAVDDRGNAERKEEIGGHRPPLQESSLQPPRFSRTAIVGAAWAPFFFITAFLWFGVAVSVHVPQGSSPPGPAWWQILLMMTVLPLGTTAPFGTTILGCVAISQIRRSAGKLCGLGLALFDALLFPLLMLDGLIGWVWWGGLKLYIDLCVNPANFHLNNTTQRFDAFMLQHQTEIATFGAVATVVLVDFLIILWAWRSVKKPAGNTTAPPTGSASSVASPPPNRSGWGIAALVVCLAAIPAAAVVALICSVLDIHSWTFVLAALFGLEILALVAGVVGWRSTPGKLAVILSALLLMLSVPLGVVFGLRAHQVAAVQAHQVALVRQDVAAVAFTKMWNAQQWHREIRQQLQQRSERFDGLSMLFDTEKSVATFTFSNLQEMKGIGGSNVWVSIDGSLTAHADGNGNWEVRGSGQLGAVQFTVATPSSASVVNRGGHGSFTISHLGQGQWQGAVTASEFSVSAPQLLGQNQGGSADAPTTDMSPSVESVSFGPVFERVVNDLDDGKGNEALALASGKQFGLPEEFGRWSNQQREQWIAEKGIDLLVDFARNRWALMAKGLELTAIANECWGNRSVDLIGAALPPVVSGVEVLERGGDKFYLLAEGAKPPLTFFFKTREGGMGILQITGFADNPRGVKIRYKLVQGTGTNTLRKIGSSSAVFGLQAERTITVADANRDGVVAFRFKDDFPLQVPVTVTGHFKDLSTRGFTPALKQWMQASNADLLLYFGNNSYDVLTLDLRDGIFGQPTEWNTLDPARALPALRKLEARNSNPGPSHSSGCGYRDGLGDVHVFRTRDGLVGYYQLRGLDDADGRGVMIRYKLAQAPSAQSPVVSASVLSNDALARKLDSIVISWMNFKNAPVRESVNSIGALAKWADPDKTGVPIILVDVDPDNRTLITLDLEGISLRKALDLFAEAAGLSVSLEDGAVVLRRGAGATVKASTVNGSIRIQRGKENKNE